MKTISHVVWVGSDGIWATHLQVIDKTKQWTLGLLTNTMSIMEKIPLATISMGTKKDRKSGK